MFVMQISVRNVCFAAGAWKRNGIAAEWRAHQERTTHAEEEKKTRCRQNESHANKRAKGR